MLAVVLLGITWVPVGPAIAAPGDRAVQDAGLGDSETQRGESEKGAIGYDRPDDGQAVEVPIEEDEPSCREPTFEGSWVGPEEPTDRWIDLHVSPEDEAGSEDADGAEGAPDVFGATHEGLVHRINGSDGCTVWSTDLGDGALDLEIEDLDGDGIHELVATAYATGDEHCEEGWQGRVAVLSLDDGSLRRLLQTPLCDSTPRGPTLGDLDGDGIQDVAVAVFPSTTEGWTGVVAVDGAWLSSPAGTLDGEGDGPSNSSESALLWTHEVDAPVGAPDGVTVAHLATGEPLVALASWDGTIRGLDGATGAHQWTFEDPEERGGFGTVRAADLSGDGEPHLIATGFGQSVHVLDAMDGQRLWRWTPGATHSAWKELAVADLEGEGTLDIIVSGYVNQPAGQKLHHVQALDGNGGGILWDVILGASPYVWEMVAEDVTNDGQPEVLLTAGAGAWGTAEEAARLVHIDAEGEVQGEIAVPSWARALVTVDIDADPRDEAIVGTDDGRLWALEVPEFTRPPVSLSVS